MENGVECDADALADSVSQHRSGESHGHWSPDRAISRNCFRAFSVVLLAVGVKVRHWPLPSGCRPVVVHCDPDPAWSVRLRNDEPVTRVKMSTFKQRQSIANLLLGTNMNDDEDARKIIFTSNCVSSGTALISRHCLVEPGGSSVVLRFAHKRLARWIGHHGSRARNDTDAPCFLSVHQQYI